MKYFIINNIYNNKNFGETILKKKNSGHPENIHIMRVHGSSN